MSNSSRARRDDETTIQADLQEYVNLHRTYRKESDESTKDEIADKLDELWYRLTSEQMHQANDLLSEDDDE